MLWKQANIAPLNILVSKPLIIVSAKSVKPQTIEHDKEGYDELGYNNEITNVDRNDSIINALFSQPKTSKDVDHDNTFDSRLEFIENNVIEEKESSSESLSKALLIAPQGYEEYAFFNDIVLEEVNDNKDDYNDDEYDESYDDDDEDSIISELDEISSVITNNSINTQRSVRSTSMYAAGTSFALDKDINLILHEDEDEDDNIDQRSMDSSSSRYKSDYSSSTYGGKLHDISNTTATANITRSASLMDVSFLSDMNLVV